ncbi:MAG TPA: beta-CASP ribonuclease aCPSF1 [archaeon]|nr:beta-CASP ribonuclease aCPSF1 [archaeon]
MVLSQIKEELPKNAGITEMLYEGSEIILYTEDKEFFKNCTPQIKEIVKKVKKRIEVRADPSLVLSEEKTEELIRKAVPQDAGIKDIYFEPEFAKVVIHAEKPGLVIGKSGETLLEIRNKTFWTPDIKRAPVIDSEIIRAVRRMLHKEVDYRKKFLHKLGEKIYSQGKEVEWVRVATLGAFREVGRSCAMLQTPQSSVLVDCGMAVNPLIKPYPHLDAPEFHIQSLDAIILTHAHMDHAGSIPALYEMGYKGPLYCTRPTRDLAALLQLDYVQICQRENKKGLYSSKGIEEAIKHCVPLEFGEVTDITPDMRLTLQNAGHILGSSSAHVHVGDGLYNIVATGDIKYENTKLLNRTFTDYSRVEGLIIEATYGGSENIMPPRIEAERKIIETIQTVVKRGGKVLVPSFASGRGQDITVALTESNITVPIYLDGMLWDATAIHTAYPEFLSKYMQTLILHKQRNPFTDPRLKGVGSQKERQAVINNPDPCVIISTSGMLNGGPIFEYLKNLGNDPKNALVFVGYQAEGSTGRRIQKGWKDLQLDDGRRLELNLEVLTVNGFGGHSDFNQLMNYVNDLSAKPHRVLVNHGEPKRCVDLARNIHKEFRIEASAPRNLEIIRLR